MGRRRGMQQLLDEATRLVIAYNKATCKEPFEPIVWLDIFPHTPPAIHIGMGKYGYEDYGGANQRKRGQTLRDGVARVKELLDDYHAREADSNADKTGH